jgi:hypothetical protein
MNKRAIALFCATVAALFGYAEGPPLGYTGGFGEFTCHACHNQFEKPGPGSFEIAGVPDVYMPGAVYPITVTISQDGQSRWGFELTARYDIDVQAGDIEVTDPANTFVRIRSDVQFLTQTLDGTMAGTQNGPVSWTFNWHAPDPPGGVIYFNAAGNAADNDDFPDGDYTYTVEVVSNPPGQKR